MTTEHPAHELLDIIQFLVKQVCRKCHFAETTWIHWLLKQFKRKPKFWNSFIICTTWKCTECCIEHLSHYTTAQMNQVGTYAQTHPHKLTGVNKEMHYSFCGFQTEKRSEQQGAVCFSKQELLMQHKCAVWWELIPWSSAKCFRITLFHCSLIG